MTYPWMFVLAGGLVAGTLDIAYACAFWAVRAGVPAERIFQSVAAGPGSKDPLWVTLTIVAHMLLVGVPIALFTQRARQE